MFCKATLLAVALALVATASPVDSDHVFDPATPVTGVRIPIQKRGSLKNADGTFNYDKTIRQIVKLKKYVSHSGHVLIIADR